MHPSSLGRRAKTNPTCLPIAAAGANLTQEMHWAEEKWVPVARGEGRKEKNSCFTAAAAADELHTTTEEKGEAVKGEGGLDRPEKRESEHEHAAPSDRGTTGERRRLQTSLCPISGREGGRTGVEAARREKEKRQGRKKMKKRFFLGKQERGKTG